MIKFLKKRKEGILYIVFGCLTTLVNLLCYSFFVEILSTGITVGNIIACIVSVIFAFITNKIFVFESKSFALNTIFKEFYKFVAARAVTGIIDIFGPLLLVAIGLNQTLFGVDGFLAKIISTIIVVILNYLLSKLVVFKK